MAMKFIVSLLTATLLTALPITTFAQKKYDTGASDTEIKIGQTMPYSGPASAYGQIGKTELAYFKMINEQGGINGRKINLISVDDGYSPPWIRARRPRAVVARAAGPDPEPRADRGLRRIPRGRR